MTETRVELSTTWHHNMHPPQRMNRHQRTINHNLLRSSLKKIRCKLTKEVRQNRFLLVQTDENVRSIVFPSRVHNPRHRIHRPAAVRLHPHPHRGRHLCSVVQTLLCCGALLSIVRKHHTHRSQLSRGRSTPQHQSHIRHRNHHPRIRQSHQQRVLLLAPSIRPQGSPRKHQFACRTFRERRSNDARAQNEHHRRAHHIFVEQMRTIGQNDFIAHHSNGQSRSRARRAQPTHHISFRGIQLQSATHQLRSQQFSCGANGNHRQSHRCNVPARQQRAEIDNHSHTNQKIRNEQGVAHKLNALHQRTRGRHFAIECQAH